VIITVDRYSFINTYTRSKIYIDGCFECFGIEDAKRNTKVYGQTCIPEGTYQIRLRVWGGFHKRYSKRFSDHVGMLEVVDVPNFKYILIHIGNTIKDTAGCLLVGAKEGNLNGEAAVLSSQKAYRQLYSKVIQAMQQGEPIYIEYKSN